MSDCPECGERLANVGRAYGNDLLECKECGYVEERPDRTVQKKSKTKIWKEKEQRGTERYS